MGKKMPVNVAVFLIICAILVTFQITATHMDRKYSEAVYEITSEGSAFSKINSIDDIVRKYYVGEIDENELERGLINGYLLGLGDKYATYMDAEEFSSYSAQNNGKQAGIGITVIYDSTLRGMYVTNVTKDSPAMAAGIAAGDIITEVDGQSIAERGYYNTVSYISKGAEGEAVSLRVEKGPDYHQQRIYAVQRAIIDTYTVEYEMYKDNVGYISISSFNKMTPSEFKTAVEELTANGARAFIFDLRNNGGGDLEGIKGVLDYLLPEGPIIRIVSKNGSEQVLTSDASCVNKPMAVIINGSTASAAELFSSALRDYGMAKLVGTTSYGKGTLQTITKLTDGSALSVSTGMYNPPFSENYEGKGLRPDVEIDLTKEQYDRFYLLTLDEDPQVRAAYGALDLEDVTANTVNTSDIENDATDKNEEANQ